MLPSGDFLNLFSQLLTTPQVLMGVGVGFSLGFILRKNILDCDDEDDHVVCDDEWEPVRKKLSVFWV